MVPELKETDLRLLMSQAEAKVYVALRDQLDSDVLVLHSQCFIREAAGRSHVDGEADFVIFDPREGFLVVEVKGGGISFDPHSGAWFSTDRYGAKHRIKDPFGQARGEKFAILDVLQNDPDWRRLGFRVPTGHAVFFPDVDELSPLKRPEAPLETMGGRKHLGEIRKWYLATCAYWGGEQRKVQALGMAGLAVVDRLFCKQIDVRPLIAKELAEEERLHITLTRQQAQLLRALRQRRRAAICGGAGTGKTLLALEKARALAADGKRTLLLCYNVPLAEHFRRIIGETPYLLGMNFHQFCEWRVSAFRERTGRDLLKEAEADYPGENRFGVHYPFALTVAQEEMPELFDAIIIDEGQDFADEYWLPISVSLGDEKEGVLYIFFDDNQRLYTRTQSFPIPLDDTYYLTTNCRNTEHIHQVAYRYFGGGEVSPPPVPGAPVAAIVGPSLKAQAKRIGALITDLVSKEGVCPNEIAVLVAGQPKNAFYAALEDLPLPKPACWSRESHAVDGTVLMDTVGRFKGLEAAIVVLWLVDDIDPAVAPQIPYVGASRAKSRLYLAGTEGACQRIVLA